MADNLAELAQRIAAAGVVTDADCQAIRRTVWDDGSIGQDEADLLFAVDAACAERVSAWVDLFVEAISHLITHQVPPLGYIDDANAVWLMARIDQHRPAATILLLLKVLETANSAPDTLQSYAIGLMEYAVGAGPIDDVAANLLRRLVFAPGGDGGVYVSRAETEMLFRIKDLTLAQPNAPSWNTLFVQAVGNHFLAHPSNHRLDRDRAAEVEAFLADTQPHIARFLRRMTAGVGLAARTTVDPASVPADQAIGPDKIAELRADALTDGKLDALEQALLDFLAQETGQSAVDLEARLRGQ